MGRALTLLGASLQGMANIKDNQANAQRVGQGGQSGKGVGAMGAAPPTASSMIRDLSPDGTGAAILQSKQAQTQMAALRAEHSP